MPTRRRSGGEDYAPAAERATRPTMLRRDNEVKPFLRLWLRALTSPARGCGDIRD